MMKSAYISVRRRGNEITVSNNHGKVWKFQTTDAQGLVTGLVALSLSELFNAYSEKSFSFEMNTEIIMDN